MNKFANCSVSQSRVYHYCSTNNFLSILGESKFRIGNITKTNDTEELEYIVTLIRNMLYAKIRCEYQERSEKLLTIIDNLLDRKFNEFAKNIYIFSFSEQEDSLSQWEMYADKGKGFAIGINTEFLQHFASKFCEFGWSFGKVEYINIIDEKRKNIIKEAIDKINDKNIPETKAENILNGMVNKLFKDLAFFKHKGFEHEKEWRLVLEPKANINRIGDFQENISRIKNIDVVDYGNLKLDGIKFRPTQNGKNIVSYLDLSFIKEKNNLIKDIILGPCLDFDVSDIDLKTFLLMNGYELATAGVKTGITIRKSQIPYKSK